MAKGNFRNDSALEKQLNQKILKELQKPYYGVSLQYPNAEQNPYNSEQDRSGIDAIFASQHIFQIDGYKNVDFKSATSWIAESGKTGLGTFAFELSFLNENDELRDGWLFGDKYSFTEYYSLQWLWKKPEISQKYVQSAEDIGKVETLIVSKSKVQDYARSLNITESNFRGLSVWLASKSNDERIAYEHYYEKSGSKLKIFSKKIELSLQPERPGQQARLLCSTQLPERPVNLLIPKKDLIAMAPKSAHFFYSL